MPPSAAEIAKSVRWTTIVLGLANLAMIALASILISIGRGYCRRRDLIPITLVMIVAGFRIFSLLRTGVVQYATAIAMAGDSPHVDGDGDSVSRVYRKMQYTKWALWTRISMIVVIFQFVLAICVLFTIARVIGRDDEPNNRCVLGSIGHHVTWKEGVLIFFVIIVTFVAVLQCFTNSDVLRWRTYYLRHDNVWKAHYQEVFDHSIREALCCLGRHKYLCTMEEDEVHSVAKLLGDLVTYRASGTGHMEFLTGLALLQNKTQLPELPEGFVDAPEDILQEAITFHPFAEAAYTGPLLDVGRTLVLFPCVWLYRQGVWNAFWNRNSRPVLEGDNWWRGHAAAFLNYANVSSADLRRGRVNQAECQAAYFIVVHHRLKSIIITVRGTETPEDLITNGLCRESPLTEEDLDGLINSSNIDHEVRQRIISSFPHYGHSGIIEAARELFKQIDGSNPDDGYGIQSQPRGFLSSLLGPGCECEGYGIRLVGHSLGGSIASVLAMRLYGRYSNLHVYAFGPLPCVDLVIAEACSCFISSIVHDSEFASCLSVNSILRLRATALTAVAQDKSADESLTVRLASLFIKVSKFDGRKMGRLEAPQKVDSSMRKCNVDEHISARHSEDDVESVIGNSMDGFATTVNITIDPVTQFMNDVPTTDEKTDGPHPEIFLPGQVIHLLRQQRSLRTRLWKGWRVQERAPRYRAIIANRENFKDISVSVYMFLDHLPWRCYQAMKEVLRCRS